MYVLGINGSPRIGGNTDILLDKVLEGAGQKGAKTEKITLNTLKFFPCQECEDMPDDGTCKIKDDFQAIYRKIKEADAIILASPIFFGSLSAQTKMMIDRFQCLWRYKYQDRGQRTEDGGRKKPGAFICVEASQRDSFLENARSIVKNFFATIDVSYKEELPVKGMDEKGVVLNHQDVLGKAFTLGESLSGGN